jgi:hypothetical protein
LHGVLGLHPEVNGIVDCRLCPNADCFVQCVGVGVLAARCAVVTLAVGRAFPVGSERHLVSFEGLLLVMLAIGTQNILLSCFLTYIISGVRRQRARRCKELLTSWRRRSF